MPEEETEAPEAPEEVETEFDPARARAALEKKNREAAGLRARLKELEPLAAKAREADEATKTELQKATEARAAVERERDEARLALMKRDAAEEAGLPKAWADRLRGSTAAELLADAKALAKDFTPAPQSSARRPVADLRTGALPAGDRPSGTNTSAEIDDWIRSRGRRQ